MSYDISLKRNGESVTVDNHSEGGTYVLGGITIADLNITYNYSERFACIDPEQGIRWLYGKTGRQAIPVLEAAIATLGTDRDADYWKNTSGNAGYALSILLRWAKQHPDAVFEGD